MFTWAVYCSAKKLPCCSYFYRVGAKQKCVNTALWNACKLVVVSTDAGLRLASAFLAPVLGSAQLVLLIIADAAHAEV